MLNQRLKKAMKRLAEAVVVLALVLFFFSIVLFWLKSLFPIGQGMSDLVRRDRSAPRERRVNPSIQGQGQGVLREEAIEEILPPVPFAATLKRRRNEVKSKRAQGIAWTPANAGMELFNRDSVQTLSSSSAVISFDENSSLDMGENSLIIIRGLEEDVATHEKRSVVVIMEGELRGSLASMSTKSSFVEVATPTSVTRVHSKKGKGKNAEFKISVNPNNSSTVTVLKGQAEVVAQGKKVTVEENYTVTVEKDKAPARPSLLPIMPKPAFPPTGKIFFFRDLPPKVEFGWDSLGDAEVFRFVLARDPAFQDVVVDERITEFGFVHGNLKEGEYFWRVSGLIGWGEGKHSKAQQLKLVRDVEQPALRVEFPPEIFTGSRYTLKGSTEPGAEVFVKSQKIEVGETGEFKYEIELRRGTNVIVVEAVDLAGNITYSSQKVNGKF